MDAPTRPTVGRAGEPAAGAGNVGDELSREVLAQMALKDIAETPAHFALLLVARARALAERQQELLDKVTSVLGAG